MPGLHHLDVWIAHADELDDWSWLFARLGWNSDASWTGGATFAAGAVYITVTTTPNTANFPHDRRRPGLNHLAFTGGTSAEVDTLMAEAAAHGWRPLYAERYPHAGGAQHYAGWLENAAGFKVEIVAV
ncbi:glyoxalase [Microbacterium testaceum]|uniref:glyoxalase n=1 Tax=Microbacterium testaceum TaxID=2033 RepID=UPI000CCF355E|nr:glyoxalase [Microbacterium testaceum]PNW08215.1 glyoxalase [Microbacterium testaceum]